MRGLEAVDAAWRAANYLSVGQIYLRDNALLRESLEREHIKPRLLGHWGTSPGLNLLYAHINRVIIDRELEALLVTGPGHGGPAIVANSWLEGSWSEAYPSVGRDLDGMTQLLRQFSTPYGVPSHVSPDVPGSIHEGGELGYSLAHAFGAAFDNPDLVVFCVVGDGEAESGPLAASWRSPAFTNLARDGTVIPVLHLNGYKIANPTVLGRSSDADLIAYFRGQGWEPVFVEGEPGQQLHAQLAAAMDTMLDDCNELRAAHEGGDPWPGPASRQGRGGCRGVHDRDLGREPSAVEQALAWRARWLPQCTARRLPDIRIDEDERTVLVIRVDHRAHAYRPL